MTALVEREATRLGGSPINVNGNLLDGDGPQLNGIKTPAEVLVFQEKPVKKTRAEIVEERRGLVAEAWEKGYDQFLTEKQRLAVGRYLEVDDSGRISSLEAWRIRLRDKGLIDISRQALFVDEKTGFSRLRKISSEEEKREQQGEDLRPVIKNLYEVEGLIPYDIARRLRIPRETVCQIIEQSDDIQRRKKGRPLTSITIEDPNLINSVLGHLRNQGIVVRGIKTLVAKWD